jgi:N-acetyl-gamma-glutamyl-phosphate reductase
MRVGVAGGTGYSGQELLDLLARDKENFEVAALLGRDNFEPSRLKDLDLVFLCTPNEVSLEMAPPLLEHGVSVIDVSGAFRLKKYSYEEWYGFEHTQKTWLAKSEYALYPWTRIPSLKEKAGPRLIANPGCYATAAQMTLIPLLKAGLLDPQHVYMDAKSGTSGAGRKAQVSLLHSEVFGEFRPYKVGKHQHWPEIVENLELLSGVRLQPVFVTELLPIERGISIASFLEWHPSLSAVDRTPETLLQTFREAYAGDPSVRVGTDDSFSSLKAVQRTNRISIQVGVAFGRPMLFTVIDNLQRGAAGQALMNAYQLAGRPQPEFLL